MPSDPNEQGREDCRAENDPESGFREIAACRHSGKLAGDEFEVAFNEREVRSCLIGIAQRQDVFIWHDTRYARRWLLKRYDGLGEPSIFA